MTLPLTTPGIVAGTLLTFIPAIGDYVNAQFLGGTRQPMIGNVIQSLYLNQRNYPAAAALSFVLMALILVVVLIYIRFAGSEALMGEEAAMADADGAPGSAWGWLREHAVADLRRPRRPLHADSDRGHHSSSRSTIPPAATTSPGSGFTLDHWSNAFGDPGAQRRAAHEPQAGAAGDRDRDHRSAP